MPAIAPLSESDFPAPPTDQPPSVLPRPREKEILSLERTATGPQVLQGFPGRVVQLDPVPLACLLGCDEEERLYFAKFVINVTRLELEQIARTQGRIEAKREEGVVTRVPPFQPPFDLGQLLGISDWLYRDRGPPLRLLFTAIIGIAL